MYGQIRFYITKKLIPGAGESRGPYAVYSEDALQQEIERQGVEMSHRTDAWTSRDRIISARFSLKAERDFRS